METKEAYKEKYEAQLKEWGAKLDGLNARAHKATAQAKIDMAPHVTAMQQKIDAAKATLDKLAAATDDKWHDLKTGADAVWTDLKASAEGALAVIEGHEKKKS